MDKTETYIKMADCLEIQGGGQWWFDSGSYVTPKDGFGVGVTFWKNDLFSSSASLHADFGHGMQPKIKAKDYIWLPTQSQLQELLDEPFCALCWLPRFLDWISPPELGESPSMEQLWLSFVMEEKFSKVWTGTEWTELVA